MERKAVMYGGLFKRFSGAFLALTGDFWLFFSVLLILRAIFEKGKEVKEKVLLLKSLICRLFYNNLHS